MATAKCRVTVRQLVEEYLAVQCTHPVTKTSTRNHLAGLLALYGGWQARRLKPQQLSGYVESQLQSGVTLATAVLRAKLLLTAIRWGVVTGRLAENPLNGIRFPKPKARRVMPPSLAEARKMKAAAAPHVARVITLGMMAGPRIGPSELFRLRWEDVDLDAGVIRMPNAKKGARHESRMVPVRNDVLPELRQWRKEDASMTCPWVIHWRGKPVRCIGHAWHTARRAAGIHRIITPYSLRHAFPSNALEYDADIKSVAEIMGHSDPSMLLKTYQHIKWRQLKKAVSAGPGLGGDRKG